MSEIDVKLCDFEVEFSPQLGLRVENVVLPPAVANLLDCNDDVRFSLFIDASDGGGLHDLIAKALDEEDRALYAGGCLKLALNHCLLHVQLDAKALDLLVTAVTVGSSERVLSLDLSMMSPLEDMTIDKAGAASLLPKHLIPDAKVALFLPQIVLKVTR